MSPLKKAIYKQYLILFLCCLPILVAFGYHQIKSRYDLHRSISASMKNLRESITESMDRIILHMDELEEAASKK